MNKLQTIRKKLLTEIAIEKQILNNQKRLYDIFSSYQKGGDRTDRTEQFVINMIKNSAVSSAEKYLTALKISIRMTKNEIGKLMRKYALVKYAGKY